MFQIGLQGEVLKKLGNPEESSLIRKDMVGNRPSCSQPFCHIGSIPTTPEPNTSAKASQYTWEPYRDTNWCGVENTTFCQEEGILLQKYGDLLDGSIAIPFEISGPGVD